MSDRYILLTVIGLLIILPQASRADSITLDGVSPAVDEDITLPDNQKASEENFYTFWTLTTPSESNNAMGAKAKYKGAVSDSISVQVN